LDEANLNPTETIFACTLPRVKRFIENPDYTPKYFYYIQQMLDHHFTLDIMLPKIQSLAPYAGFETSPASGVPADTLSLTALTNYVQTRITFLESLISRELTVNVVGASRVGNEYLAFQPTVTLSGRNAAEELVRYAASRNVTRIVVGKPKQPRWKEFLKGSLVYELTRRCGDIDVYVVSATSEEQGRRTAPTRGGRRWRSTRGSSRTRRPPATWCTTRSFR
jgi:nucleotide-binding universal stress UspA family protein